MHVKVEKKMQDTKAVKNSMRSSFCFNHIWFWKIDNLRVLYEKPVFDSL